MVAEFLTPLDLSDELVEIEGLRSPIQPPAQRLTLRGNPPPHERDRATVPWIRFEPWVQSPRHVAGFIGVIGSVVFYIVAANWLGFLLTSLIILTVLFRLFGVALGRSIVMAAIATFVIHFAFYKLLRVPLPWGVLTNYAW